MSAIRLPHGGYIDRSQPLQFTWDSRAFSGYHGDTLASALLANDQRVLARSFKYHRPRGVMAAGVEESGALVTLGRGAYRDPNVKASTQELYEGLVARGQNAWPSVRYDCGAINDLCGRFFAAGFYYKTFMGLPPFEYGHGTAMWMRYEKLIRRAAGMGRASRLADAAHYEHGHAFCEVLVVGGGLAGMNAALSAARAGLDVLLVEQDSRLGGDLLHQSGTAAAAKCAELCAALAAAGVRVMLRTTAFGLYDHATAGLLQRLTDHLSQPPPQLPRQCFWTLRAQRIVLASGAIEQPIAFANNDRVGVMGTGAARAYLNRYAVRAGQNIIVTTNNDSAYAAAFDLAQAEARVCLFDARARVADTLLEQAEHHGITLHLQSTALRALGRPCVTGVQRAVAINQHSDSQHFAWPYAWRSAATHACDLLLVSGGWSPVIHLASQRGLRPHWDAAQACFVVEPSAAAQHALHLAGCAAGYWQSADCAASGNAAGLAAAAALGKSVERLDPPRHEPSAIRPLYEVRAAGVKGKSLVDFQHDVTSDDIRLAAREGFIAPEHLKRYTTLGMATDGGKVGNVVGLGILAATLRKPIATVGSTTFRPPYTPIALGALAGPSVGEHFRPLRRTPLHDWNVAQGATMQMAGLWHRPWYFARPGEDITAAYIREAATTRATVGLCDVTSLGKIALQGRDATELLNRVYTNPFAKLPIGKARYGIMLRDDGIVMDDGTTWRLAETEYFMTTTTANAAKVLAFLEELLHTRWPELQVHVTSVSEQWAGVAVAGPQARAVLQQCVQDPAAVSHAACPFMGVLETQLKGGIAVRIARISFSGERAYEVYAPSDYATAMMELLWGAAEPRGGCLYGLEALGTLRIEKGHVTAAELDGRVTLDDAGLGKLASPHKAFIGSALRQREQLQQTDRPRLVGIKPRDRAQRFNAGAILCRPGQISGCGDGWVTAVTHSPALQHWIGLGFIRGGHPAWQGQTAIATDPLRQADVEVELVSPHLYDPTGERLHG